jgi:hypothetical protein
MKEKETSKVKSIKKINKTKLIDYIQLIKI